MQTLHPLKIELLSLDVTDDTAVEAVISTVIANEGHIDVVVNNAGVGCYGALTEPLRFALSPDEHFARANVGIIARTSPGCL